MRRGGAGAEALPAWWGRVVDGLALERSVVAVALTTCLMTLGEELWRRFLPKYLEALGAPVTAIGLYGSTRDTLDGLYQLPGGWAADRFGRRRALLAFVGCALLGYVVLAAAPAWPVVFLSLVLVMAWSSMASPALFAVIGDAMPRERRAMGFSVQSILRRIPMAVAPLFGGLLIAGYGVRDGVRVGLAASILLACAALGVASRVRVALPAPGGSEGLRAVWRMFPTPLRRLLASDVLVRTCEGLADVIVLLYVLDVVGVDPPHYGVLVAVQMLTSIVSYLPAARVADRAGRKPLVVLTFLAFAAFPLAVAASGSMPALVGAFVGGLLWQLSPRTPFLAAGVVGLAGVVVFALTVEERHAA